MKRPIEAGRQGTPYVRLRKAIYGLKQSSKIFNDKMNKFLLSIGFSRSIAEPCLYTMGTGPEQLVIGVYVDDLIICAASTHRLNWLKGQLSDSFPMKDIGEAKTILGMEITRADGKLQLGLKKYFDIIMKRFQMDAEYSSPIPIDANVD